MLTLGCRTNQAESARLEEQLVAVGHITTRSLSDADVIVINSCSVTSKADQQSRQLISKALRSGSRVIVTGCYADLNMERLSRETGNIDIVPNKFKDDIINRIPNDICGTSPVELTVPRRRPIMKIQDGCNNSCSYCIIPRARGLSRSILPETILDEVINYDSLGYKEVVLSGIHLGVYGQDLIPAFSLTELLELLLIKTKINRIRLSSIEITEVTDGILDLMKENRICQHLHLPLQGGTDKTLKSMNRPYTIDEYKRVLERIIQANDNIGIGTDIIVGFPDETDEDYERSLKEVSSMQFSYLHVFPYSGRPGTAAYNMPNQVAAQTKKNRARQMTELGSLKRANFITKNMEYEHDIVIESVRNGRAIGTTSNYIKAILDSDKEIVAGMLMKVRIAGRYGSDAAAIPLT